MFGIQSDKYVLSLPKFDTIFNFRCVAFGHSTIIYIQCFEMIFFFFWLVIVKYGDLNLDCHQFVTILKDGRNHLLVIQQDCILRNWRRMNDSDFSIIVKLFILHNTRAEKGGAKCPIFFASHWPIGDVADFIYISSDYFLLLRQRWEKKKPLCGCIRCSIYQSNKMYNLFASNSNVPVVTKYRKRSKKKTDSTEIY